MRIGIFLFLISVITFGCKPAAEVKGSAQIVAATTQLTLNFPKSSSINPTQASYFIWGKSPQASFGFGGPFSATENKTLTLVSGDWTFYIVTWLDTSLAGTLKCAVQSKFLKGLDESLSLTVTSSNCNDPRFGSNAFNGAKFRPLKLISCRNVAGAVADGSCDAVNVLNKGVTASFKVELQPFFKSPVGNPPNMLAGLSSVCQGPGSFVSSSAFISALTTPPGTGPASPFRTVIKAYPTIDCTGTEKVFVFPSGIAGPTEEPQASRSFISAAETQVFVKHNIAAAQIPTVTNITGPPGIFASTGGHPTAFPSSILFTVTLSENVNFTTPVLNINIGGIARTASCSGAAGSNTLTCIYSPVVGGDSGFAGMKITSITGSINSVDYPAVKADVSSLNFLLPNIITLPTNSLIAWYDANENFYTNVSGFDYWENRMSNAYHWKMTTGSASPARSATAFKGMPGYTFDGTQYFGPSTTPLQQSAFNTIFVVYRMGSSSNADQYLIGASLSGANKTAINLFKSGGDPRNYVLTRGNSTVTMGSNPLSIDTGSYHLVVMQTGSDVITLFNENQEQSLSTNSTTGTPSGGNFFLGALNNLGSPSDYFSGVIAEVMFFSTATMTTTQREGVIGYLKNKWQL